MLPRCLRSIEAQTYEGWRVYAIDDGSTDTTKDILYDFMHKTGKTTIIEFGKNRGIPSANNAARKAILHNRCEHICWVAADDEWRPRKLEAQLAFHEEVGCDVSYTDYTLVGQDATISKIVSPDWDPERYVWVNFLHGSTVMWSRRVLENIAWDEQFRNCEDWDYGLTCIEEGFEFDHLPENTCISYRHADNISNKRVTEAYYHALVSMKHDIPLVVDAARMMRIGDPHMINGVLKAVMEITHREERKDQDDD